MVAYSFKARFAEPILAGTKAQTIRAHRKRHARSGEQLQLYTGMRTKHCRLLGRATCASVQPVRLEFGKTDTGILVDGFWLTMPEMTEFVRADGFESVEDMRDFWRVTHATDRFSGVLVKWGALQ